MAVDGALRASLHPWGRFGQLSSRRATGFVLEPDIMFVAQEFCPKPSGMTEWQPLPQDGATGGRAGRSW